MLQLQYRMNPVTRRSFLQLAFYFLQEALQYFLISPVADFVISLRASDSVYSLSAVIEDF